MTSKKVILLYTSCSKIVNSNTEYLNELKKSNTFWLFGVAYLIFFRSFKIQGRLLKKFLSNTGYLNELKKSNTLRF